MSVSPSKPIAWRPKTDATSRVSTVNSLSTASTLLCLVSSPFSSKLHVVSLVMRALMLKTTLAAAITKVSDRVDRTKFCTSPCITMCTHSTSFPLLHSLSRAKVFDCQQLHKVALLEGGARMGHTLGRAMSWGKKFSASVVKAAIENKNSRGLYNCRTCASSAKSTPYLQAALT